MRYIAMFLFLVTLNAIAGAPVNLNEFLKYSICNDKIESLIESWGSANAWQEEFRQRNVPLIIKTPTKEIGQWIFMVKNPSHQVVSLTKLSSHLKIHVTWSTDDCAQKVAEIKVASNDDSSFSFSDQDLKELLDQKKNGLIYVFSPFMHFSVEGIGEMKKIAAQLNLGLTILIDSEFSMTQSQKVDYPIMESKELLYRGMSTHYPSLLVYSKDGKMSNVLPGRKNNETYVKFIKEFLK